MPPRHFPVPWTFEDHNNACFIVKDASGLAVNVYYEEDRDRETCWTAAVDVSAPFSFSDLCRHPVFDPFVIPVTARPRG